MTVRSGTIDQDLIPANAQNRYFVRSSDLPLSCLVPYDDFLHRLTHHELPGGVMYQVTAVPDIDTANRVMDQVRSYTI